MSSAAKETSQLASRRRPRRSKGHRHETKRHAGDAAAVDDVSNERVFDELHGGHEGHDERELVDERENEDTEQSSVSMQNILGQFLATKLQVIESENQRVPRSTVHKKSQKDRSRRSSGKRSRNKRSSEFSDLPGNDEFNRDKSANDCWSDSKNPKRLDFWNDSERSSSCAMFDRTCLETVRGDHRQSHGNVRQRRDETWTREETVQHHGFRSSAFQNRYGLERFNGNNETFPFSDVSLEYIPSLHKVKDGFRASEAESWHDPTLEIRHEYQSEVHEDNHVKSESHVHRSRRKRSFPEKKSKEASESRHRKSKKTRHKQDSEEVSNFVNPNFLTTPSHAESASRFHQDSLYDDLSSVSSESDDKNFGNFSGERHGGNFSGERHIGSRQKSSDYFQPGIKLCKPDNEMFKDHRQNADLKPNDIVGNETWAERYNRTKYFKRRRSHSGSTPAEADTDALQYDKYSNLNTTDPVWGHSSKHNRLAYEGEVHMSCGDTSNAFSHSRNKMHSTTKSPRSSSKKKSSRKVKSVDKREKKHKRRDKSLAKSSHKPTKHKRRKTKKEDKVLAESKVDVEIAKSCVLPSNDDADDNFRPMPIAVENNDEFAELWLGKRTTSADDAHEQGGVLQLDYNAVVACAEKISVPSRIVKTYKEGIAVSRLLRRVKTRMAPLRLAEMSRLQATLPRHTVVTIDKHSQQKSANNDQLENSTVVQDVEDPGVQRQDQPQTCGSLPTISDVTADDTSDDILQSLGVSGVVQAGPVHYLGFIADTSVNVESSDPDHQEQLLVQTVALQESVQLNPSPECGQALKQDFEAETSVVDSITTVEMVTATVEPCLMLSSESQVTGTGSVEATESKTHASDSFEEESTPVFPVSASVQTIDDDLTLHAVVQLLENSCIPHSSDPNEGAVADEVQNNLRSNCGVTPELTCDSCFSDGNIQNVGSDEVTAIISPNKEMSLEDVADSIADRSVSHGTTFVEETGHIMSDTGQQDEVSKSRQDQMQCATLVASDIVEMGAEMTGIEESQKEVHDTEMTGIEESQKEVHDTEMTAIEESQKEVPDKEITSKEGSENDSSVNEVHAIEVTEKEVTEKEVTEKEVAGNEVAEKEVTGKEVAEKEVAEIVVAEIEVAEIEVAEKEVAEKEVAEKEVCDNEATGSEVGDAEVELHCTEKKMNPENEEVVNEASNSQGMFCDETGVVGHTKEIILASSSQSLTAEQNSGTQTLKADSLIKFVKAGCSEVSCDTAELCFRPPKSPEPREDCRIVRKTRPTKKMGIKISGWSAAFISSGTRYENDPKKRNREEGELTDSSAHSSESESGEPAVPVECVPGVECVSGLESSASMSESTEGEIEEPVVKPKSKHRKKHKRKHKKHKKQKRQQPIESSSEESRSRSRGRSFSVARTFDGERGVWREKKLKHRKKKVPVKNRPRLNIDKEKLREIAIKNSRHNQLSFKRSGSAMRFNRSTMMKSSEAAGIRPGGKSVAELTDFCKTISGRLDYSTSSSEDENGRDVRRRAMDDNLDDETEAFMSNFMKSRDKDARIVVNIRDSRQLPALSAQEMMAKKAVMRLMFPVSNGAQHRRSEEGWVPVTKPDSLSRPQVSSTDPPLQTITIPAVPPTSAGMAAVELATARAPVVEDPFLVPLPPNVDVSVIIKERLAAIKRLHEDPTNEEAMGDVVRAQMQMQQWAEAKQVPGQFFSSVLRMGLMGNKLKKHDWLRRTKQNPEPDAAAAAAASQTDASGGDDCTTYFASTLDTPVGTGPDKTYNIGKLMMLRMGWKESEGLGRQNLGRLTPLSLNMKKDRRGLQAREETLRPVAQVLSVKGKHPVSALLESCMKRRIGQPEFVLIDETGPAHSKRFLYKVLLNGVEYQPNVGSNNKKTAKLQAAACCLDALGLSGGSK